MEHANFSSERLQMVLITKEHAAIVHTVFQDPELFTYLPNDPPELERLEKQYAFWEGREAPDGSEYWLNYVLFLSSTGAFVGTLQSGVHRETREASIAYVIATDFQGRGLGTEATRALIAHLKQRYEISGVKAWIDTRNRTSIRLVEKLGMRQVEFIKNADHFKGQDSDEFVYYMDCP